MRYAGAHIRDLRVAAPLKGILAVLATGVRARARHIRDLRVAAPLKVIPGLSASSSAGNIRDLRVAAPLKLYSIISSGCSGQRYDSTAKALAPE